MTDVSTMADGPHEGQALLGLKVTKPLELEGFRCRMTRTGKTSEIETCPRANSVGCTFMCPPPPRESSGRGPGHAGRIM